MGEFEEIVGDLNDIQYEEVSVQLAYDASIASGFLHHENCGCDNRTLVLSFMIHSAEEKKVNIAVLPDTPLWKALVDGRFQARVHERIAETA